MKRSTLCAVRGSALEAMFSGRHAVCDKKHGKVFIDRNPEAFKLLIDFLRNEGQIEDTLTELQKKILDHELNYWEINKFQYRSSRPNKDKYEVIQEILDRPFTDTLNIDYKMPFFTEAL